MRLVVLTLSLLALPGCQQATKGTTRTAQVEVPDDRPTAAPPVKKGQAEAIFAAGCFWCSESDFEKLDGVLEVVSGYTAGQIERPTYKQVGSGLTGHTEAIRVIYDPSAIAYDQLLAWYWRHVDPFDGEGQFCDRGTQYRPGIYAVDDAQLAAAKASKDDMRQRFERPILVEVAPATTFWVAEDYHQDFYETNPSHYQRYRLGCGRDRRVAEIWQGRDDGPMPAGVPH